MYESNWIRLLVVSPYMDFFFNPNVSVQSNFSLHFGTPRIASAALQQCVHSLQSFDNEDRLGLDLIMMGFRR